LVGRRRELNYLLDLLDRADGRLITITGLGGVGKTRLALQVAWELAASFSDGVYFVPLAPVSSPDFLVSAIVNVLSFEPLPQEEPYQQLSTHLATSFAMRSKQMAAHPNTCNYFRSKCSTQNDSDVSLLLVSDKVQLA
jgi:predicted ATPase